MGGDNALKVQDFPSYARPWRPLGNEARGEERASKNKGVTFPHVAPSRASVGEGVLEGTVLPMPEPPRCRAQRAAEEG